MRIEETNLREQLNRARLSFDIQLAEVLAGRPDLSHAEIEKEFGISNKVIRRVTRQFKLARRKRGRKT